jgi:hypothetical protein
MKIFRTEILGHIIESRQGDLGRNRVLVDGQIVSTKLFGGWYNASHFIEIEDEDGKTRHVEVGWVDRSKLKIGRYRMRISVDGVERGEVTPIDPSRAPGSCNNCGYSLKGLMITNGEIQCPECGRHSSAALIDSKLIQE